MAYQLTSLSIWVLEFLRGCPMHRDAIFQTLVQGHVERITRVRPGALTCVVDHLIDGLTEQKLIRQAATAPGGKRPKPVNDEITDVGAEALGERVRELIAARFEEFPEFVVALAEIDDIDPGTAAYAVVDRIRLLDARVAEIRALREGGVTQAGSMWRWTTCWRQCNPSYRGCKDLPTRCDPVGRTSWSGERLLHPRPSWGAETR